MNDRLYPCFEVVKNFESYVLFFYLSESKSFVVLHSLDHRTIVSELHVRNQFVDLPVYSDFPIPDLADWLKIQYEKVTPEDIQSARLNGFL